MIRTYPDVAPGTYSTVRTTYWTRMRLPTTGKCAGVVSLADPYLVTRDIRLKLVGGNAEVYDEREATASQWSKYVKEFSLRRLNTVSYFPETEALTGRRAQGLPEA
jgi:hypothetical protein